jgi:DNA-binding transcriptional LysR family regulator
MTEAQLRAFVAVAEHRSFAGAAVALHMSQPGVSRAVRSLEAELGGQLFTRTGSHTTITELGESALLRARTVLAEADAMRHERDDQHRIAGGHVRLGSMPSVSASLLPTLITRLERRHPGLQLTVIDGHDDELIDWVHDGIVDLAIVAGQPAGLELQPLITDEFLAVVPRTHPLAKAKTIDRRALADLPFILTRAGCEKLILQALAAAGVVPTVSHEVTEAASILALVGEGLGVSIVPRLAAPRIPASVVLRPLRPAARRPLSLATSPERAPSSAVQVVLREAATWNPPYRRPSKPERPLSQSER